MQLTKTFLIMKMTACLMLIGCLTAGAHGFSQGITLSVRDVPLKTVFIELNKQTGFNFLFSDEMLEGARKVTVDVKNARLEDVLNLCFKDQPLQFSIVNKTILIKAAPGGRPVDRPLPPQEIRGWIVNEKGEGVVATITIKGTKNAVSSDATGAFVLKEADKNSVLVVTGVSIETLEYKLNGRTEVSISVKTKSVSNDPLVVTAYGIEKRTKELGYSVAKVSGEEINKANSGNLLTGLIGKVSGMSITTQSSDMNPQMRILIRGIRSFGQSSNNQPLFIFNGSPLSFGSDQDGAQLVMDFINNLNPADIEDVTILKGANGTAIYGPEGVNGVIIITTKRGMKGRPVINFRSNNSVQLVDWRNDKRQRQFGAGMGDGIYSSQSTYSWGPKYDGHLVPIGYPDENGVTQMVPYSDNKSSHQFFNLARVNRNNLSFSQSDNVSAFYLGLGYTDQAGLLLRDRQNQATIILNSSRTFGKTSIQLNINYARTNQDAGPDLQGKIQTLPTFIPITKYKDYVNDHWSQPDNYWNGISPYQEIDRNRTKGTSNALNGSIQLLFKPLSWLTVKEQPGINYSGFYSKGTVAPVYFSDYTKATDPNKYFDLFPGVSETMISNTSLNNDLLFSSIHHAGNFLIRANVGNSIRQNYVKNLTNKATLVVPVYNLAYYMYQPQIQETDVLSRQYSFFGNALAGYKDRVFLEVTGRNEWDSKRAAAARGKDFYFGANTSVVLTDVVPALKTFKWLTTARLRASIAKSANMNIVPYQSERRLGLGYGYPFVNNYTGDYLLSYSFYSGTPNPTLRPETVISQEYGSYFNFLNNRITLDVTYYYQKNNSAILSVNNAWLSGYPTIDNAGAFENHGWEFDLNMNPLVKLPHDMAISLQGRFALNNNKVLSLTPVYKGFFPVIDNTGQQLYARTGNSAYEYAVRDWKRDPQGRVIVDRLTGLPIPMGYDEFVLRGRTLPKYMASFSLGFTWKHLSMSVQADYSGGNDHLFDPFSAFYAGTHPLTLLNGREKFVFPNSVYDDGTGKYVENKDVVVSSTGQQLYTLFATVNEHGLVNGAFWKIRELAIQYEWPLQKNWIKAVSCSIYGRDLFSFYPKSNVNGDPGLIKGPGQRGFTVANNNLTGATSEISSLPGTVLLGFVTTVTF